MLALAVGLLHSVLHGAASPNESKRRVNPVCAWTRRRLRLARQKHNQSHRITDDTSHMRKGTTGGDAGPRITSICWMLQQPLRDTDTRGRPPAGAGRAPRRFYLNWTLSVPP